MIKILCFILSFPLACVGQKLHKRYTAPQELDSIQYNITPKTYAPSHIALPFSGIEVIDARFDTTKLGFQIHTQYDVIHLRDFKRIKLTGGVQAALQDFYNDYYGLGLNKTSNKLLVVLKTLWINNVPNNNYYGNVRYDIARESYQNIYVKLEYYMKKEQQYFPITRLDTVYQLTEAGMHSADIKFKKNDLSFFSYVIKSVIEKYNFQELISKSINRKILVANDIDSFNKKRYLLPALIDMNFKEGVFLDTKEFIANKPSAAKYAFKKIKGVKYLYINDDTKDHYYFVISDTSGLHFGSNKDQDIRRFENTFEFFTDANVFLPKTIGGNLLAMGSAGEKGAKKVFLTVPRQLNMETGEIY